MFSSLRVKFTIANSDPSIYRIIELQPEVSLQILHEIVQAAFEWTNSHVHYFKDASGKILKNEEDISATQILQKGKPLHYIYDFANSWTIIIELIDAVNENTILDVTARCIEGQLNSPPEDAGGITAYSDALELLTKHREKKRPFPLIAEWLGEDYDSAAFNIKNVNNLLSHIVIG
ncbi:MAG TPA: plasmid pRiA4b ORF-3 family protein [Tenuifilaceae bacterium]|nr:plasmid pRiA4b ORF-3 family protein [Tenuifilaceae bacterium]HRX30905.1 plasmid pRiA4b ORF-3 family protein [Tenuifilaceae bacterium]